jgi:hypothetical protein
MHLSSEQAHAITGGVWLIGLGVLFYTGMWWPGIMFVIGGAMIIEGLARGRGWYAFQGGLWVIAIGVWALFHFHIAVILITLGISAILGALVRPPMLDKKPPAPSSYLD